VIENVRIKAVRIRCSKRRKSSQVISPNLHSSIIRNTFYIILYLIIYHCKYLTILNKLPLMPNKVSKSDNLLQKEAELADIIKEKKKTKRNLKSNKTRIKNDRSKIADLQREMDITMHSHEKILFDLQSELLECLKNAKLSKKIAEDENLAK